MITLEGLIWTPERNIAPELIIKPDTSGLNYQDWQNYWAERHARMATLPEIYAGIKHDGLTFGKNSSDTAPNWIFTASTLFHIQDKFSAVECYQVTHFFDTPKRDYLAIPMDLYQRLDSFLVDSHKDARAILGTTDSQKEIFDTLTRYFGGLEIDICAQSQSHQTKIITLGFGGDKDFGLLDFSSILPSSEGCSSYGVLL